METTQQKKSVKQYFEEAVRLTREIKHQQSDLDALLESLKDVHEIKPTAAKAVIAEALEEKSTQQIEKHKEIVELKQSFIGEWG